MRIFRIGMTGVVLAAMISGCGGNDTSAPIEKSPYAPTPDQIKAMEKEAMQSAKGNRTPKK
ncbi:hypothetical protein [Singulisphaera acidiphila]|uniref:Lipoprotein n=1 Tax=Singulisphaera acidiphila (strain ATCC BAA-1392 / DSM 18658 / VKM B-2454 / MOB10) TaxID=886293 RepID=L0DL50_SINAD|nr:hypothetical protein [Singulisphaera acidiphila]AGA29560.1 hypothetical protein Sinac_5412 [Singulisphaera acidiphila DSM 18658]